MSLPQDVKGEAAGSAYFSIEPGQNEFLIVGPAVTGYQYWRMKADQFAKLKCSMNLFPTIVE